jgi:hypothetical protein
MSRRVEVAPTRDVVRPPGSVSITPTTTKPPPRNSSRRRGEPINSSAQTGAVVLPFLWHSCGMTRVRVSTTVDGELLERAREAHDATTDAGLLDDALRALLARHRAAKIDQAYKAYDDHPIDEPDEWGDLASFREAAGAS